MTQRERVYTSGQQLVNALISAAAVILILRLVVDTILFKSGPRVSLDIEGGEKCTFAATYCCLVTDQGGLSDQKVTPWIIS